MPPYNDKIELEQLYLMKTIPATPDFEYEQAAMLQSQLAVCLEARSSLLNDNREGALRLFNGFYEGLPGLVVDLYGKTLVISNHARDPEAVRKAAELALAFYQDKLPSISAALLKTRAAKEVQSQRGELVLGTNADKEITENKVRYALNLRLNQDSSFYLDTRLLRQYLRKNSDGKSVLNCFAYTGALGIAALAGGARNVLQTDLNADALKLARRSYGLNHFSGSMNLLPLDFFKAVSRFKTSRMLFDCVILDPPLFSTTEAGTVSLTENWLTLVNKVRPLVADGGLLIAINNALYLSGAELSESLESLTRSGYVEIETRIPVPEDITGYSATIRDKPPASPAPYNHPTKITVLRIHRKDGAKANT
ncbi:MAG TPA: class I SAM-dependent methyltransferase [Anaerolineaceae bacterium]|nr:class I SAM-dependent methyltransferase [Anaerolineaceae bacterium]NMD26723.1 methyltransferase [Chloroflexota bacterium]HOA21137.1 class I SAM-dependent methyltransferase [Anaerolineaceae bacterium]HOG77115.1 class I SAM-dependent methyltransferase [Anaerolineaceae bacterium]